MNVICLEEETFYLLVEKVVMRMMEIIPNKQDKWISDKEAMHKLRITSKTTLQKLRNQGKIRFTQPQKKIILYDPDSITRYLEKHARNTF